MTTEKANRIVDWITSNVKPKRILHVLRIDPTWPEEYPEGELTEDALWFVRDELRKAAMRRIEEECALPEEELAQVQS